MEFGGVGVPERDQVLWGKKRGNQFETSDFVTRGSRHSRLKAPLPRLHRSLSSPF